MTRTREARRCAWGGCRARALTGEHYCRAHRDRAGTAAVAGQASLPPAEEIAVIRTMIARTAALNALEEDPGKSALTVARLIEALVRLLRAQQLIAGEPDDPVEAMMYDVLEELGLGPRVW